MLNVHFTTSCRLIKEQQVLNGPYRLFPLHRPYKTVDSSLREAKNNVRGLLVACMWRATRSPPRLSARCLLGGCSLPRLLARSIACLLPIPRYPSSLPFPPTPSVHVRHSLPSAAFLPFHTLPAVVARHRSNSLAPSSFLPRSLARSLVHLHHDSLATLAPSPAQCAHPPLAHSLDPPPCPALSYPPSLSPFLPLHLSLTLPPSQAGKERFTRQERKESMCEI
jgi:hypothetical protein